MFFIIRSFEVNRAQMQATSQIEPTALGTTGDSSARHRNPKIHIMQQGPRILGPIRFYIHVAAFSTH
jgi:hypothetical protein